jgi:SAM-dependent methyltransferase
MRRCLACDACFEAAAVRCPTCGHEPPSIDGFPAFAPELAAEGGGFRPEYFEQLAALEAASFWFRARNDLIAWACQTYFPAASRFLEIGCGTGYVLSRVAEVFPSAQLTGSEVFTAGLAVARRRVPQAELCQMDARRIPFASHFDLVGAFDVLEHVDEDEQVVAEIHRALRSGGGLVLTVPQHAWLWSRQDELACHVRRYAASDLEQKLVRAGFEPLFRTSFVALLLPLMWLSRRLRDAAGDEDASSELRTGKVADAILGAVMAVERALIRSGLRFPVGGSLLLVARKT